MMHNSGAPKDSFYGYLFRHIQYRQPSTCQFGRVKSPQNFGLIFEEN